MSFPRFVQEQKPRRNCNTWRKAALLPNRPTLLDSTKPRLRFFDCEVDQLDQAMAEELQPLLREVGLDLLKINAGLSFALSACDAGRTHTVLHKSARNLRSANKPSFLEPNTNLVKRMDRMIKAARNDIVQNKKYAFFLTVSYCTCSTRRPLLPFLNCISAFPVILSQALTRKNVMEGFHKV